jgi:hypothetical protein
MQTASRMHLLDLTLYAVIAAGTVWFWLHCARPALTAHHAAPLAHSLVLGVTVLTAIFYALAAAAEVAQVGIAVPWPITTIVGVLWISVVGLGYIQDYAILRRFTKRSVRSD